MSYIFGAFLLVICKTTAAPTEIEAAVCILSISFRLFVKSMLQFNELFRIPLNQTLDSFMCFRIIMIKIVDSLFELGLLIYSQFIIRHKTDFILFSKVVDSVFGAKEYNGKPRFL